MRDFIDRLRNDRVEQVFAILTVGGVIIFFGLYFFAPDEILGMSKGFILVLTIQFVEHLFLLELFGLQQLTQVQVKWFHLC